MTRYEKIAISLPTRAAENVRRAVKRGEAASVSAYITAAIEDKVQEQTQDEFLAELMSDVGGAPSVAERDWARRILDDASRRAAKGLGGVIDARKSYSKLARGRRQRRRRS
jgi:Arc/MetJ-type ribon-helix-helix transcriptional regulator